VRYVRFRVFCTTKKKKKKKQWNKIIIIRRRTWDVIYRRVVTKLTFLDVTNVIRSIKNHTIMYNIRARFSYELVRMTSCRHRFWPYRSVPIRYKSHVKRDMSFQHRIPWTIFLQLNAYTLRFGVVYIRVLFQMRKLQSGRNHIFHYNQCVIATGCNYCRKNIANRMNRIGQLFIM
jgi:hypothetical protein